MRGVGLELVDMLEDWKDTGVDSVMEDRRMEQEDMVMVQNQDMVLEQDIVPDVEVAEDMVG